MSTSRERGQADPGEVRTYARMLDRAPGERYRAPRPPAAPPRARTGRAAAVGIVAALAAGLAMGVLSAILDLGAGMLVIQALAGWGVGLAVAWAAWRWEAHPPSGAVGAVGAGAALLAWLAGSVVDWVASLALVPASSRSLGERLAAEPFPAWLVPQLSILDVVGVALLAVIAYRTAR
jgi:hypothetical protein